MSQYKKLMYVLAWTALSIIINTRMLKPCIDLMLILKAWRTLLVYTSVTPCLMHDSRSRKGTVFVPKHGKKTCKGTD